MPSIRRAAVITIDRDGVGGGLAQLRAVAERCGVELVEGDDADIVVVLGGDGTMLRALARYLGTGIPVIGVNYGRVGFLTSIPSVELETGIARVFAGEFRTVRLSTLEVRVNGTTKAAVNDVVVAGGTLGRMIEIGYSIGGEDLGYQPCDGLICATPTGSTAYNLSNGGPVLVWGLDALAVTFVAPHSLHARPLVVPRGRDVTIRNETPDVAFTLLVDGHRAREVEPGGEVAIRLGDQKTLLASLPEVTFFRRYRDTFGS